MLSLFRKEINSFLDSMIAYVVISVFLAGVGLLVWVFPETSILDYGFAEMDSFFTMAPFIFLFLVPAITMRSFSEETRNGTLEILLTKPLGSFELVLGKFLAAFVISIFAISLTLVYYFSIYRLGNPAGNLDSAGVFGSYLGLVLLAGVFTSIGILSSSLTPNQIVSFVLAAFSCFLLYSGLASIASIDVWGTFSHQLDRLGLLYHYSALGKGLVDSRNLIYLISVTAAMLMATGLVLKIKRW